MTLRSALLLAPEPLESPEDGRLEARESWASRSRHSWRCCPRATRARDSRAAAKGLGSKERRQDTPFARRVQGCVDRIRTLFQQTEDRDQQPARLGLLVGVVRPLGRVLL